MDLGAGFRVVGEAVVLDWGAPAEIRGTKVNERRTMTRKTWIRRTMVHA